MDAHTTLRSDCPICGTDMNGKPVPCPHVAAEMEDSEPFAAMMQANTTWAKY